MNLLNVLRNHQQDTPIPDAGASAGPPEQRPVIGNGLPLSPAITIDERRLTLVTAAHRRARLQRATGYRRLEAAVAEKRALRGSRQRDPRGGRAWLNGRELGGEDSRYEHLNGSHD